MPLPEVVGSPLRSELGVRLARGRPRNDVDHSPERGAAIDGRRGPFDDLNAGRRCQVDLPVDVRRLTVRFRHRHAVGQQQHAARAERDPHAGTANRDSQVVHPGHVAGVHARNL